MAYRFSNAPATEIADVINKVTFPSLSKVQDDDTKLRDGYFRTLRFSFFLAAPAATGIAITAPEFVVVILGRDWRPAVPVMQALAIWGAIRALTTVNGPVLHTISRPDIVLKLQTMRVALIGVGIYFAASEYGLLGVAYVLMGAALLVAPVGVYITLRMIDGSLWRYVRTVAHPLTGSAVMIGVLLGVKDVISFPGPAVELVLLIALGAITYTAYSLIAMSWFGYPVGDDISSVIDSFGQ